MFQWVRQTIQDIQRKSYLFISLTSHFILWGNQFCGCPFISIFKHTYTYKHTHTHTLYTCTQDNMEIFFNLLFFHIALYMDIFSDLCLYVQEKNPTLFSLPLDFQNHTVLVKFGIFANVYDYFHFLIYEFPISQKKLLTDLKKNCFHT